MGLSLSLPDSEEVVKANNDRDNEFIDINDLIDPKLRALSTILLAMQRLECVADAYVPGTLLPRLYQTNPFAQQTEPTEMDRVLYQLSAVEVASTVQEIEAVAKEDAKEEALSEAVETLLATTSRVGSKM
jgi:hypothetical protein